MITSAIVVTLANIGLLVYLLREKPKQELIEAAKEQGFAEGVKVGVKWGREAAEKVQS